jgi:hypothetical protein
MSRISSIIIFKALLMSLEENDELSFELITSESTLHQFMSTLGLIKFSLLLAINKHSNTFM